MTDLIEMVRKITNNGSEQKNQDAFELQKKVKVICKNHKIDVAKINRDSFPTVCQLLNYRVSQR